MTRKHPNILLFLVDELRYPTVYDSAELRAWMTKNLRAQTVLRENSAFDPGMFWLDPDMVPTMGDYFRAAGYRTHYKGSGS